MPHEKCKCGSEDTSARTVGRYGEWCAIACTTCGRTGPTTATELLAWAAWDKDRREERRIWEAMRAECSCLIAGVMCEHKDRGNPNGSRLSCVLAACPRLKEADDE